MKGVFMDNRINMFEFSLKYGVEQNKQHLYIQVYANQKITVKNVLNILPNHIYIFWN